MKITVVILLLIVAPAGVADEVLTWSDLPALPFGLAGPFVGYLGDTLLVAGGANFPEGMPWKGGKKVWWDDIYVLEDRWITSSRLPRPLAYGVSVTLDEGVLCIGGCDATNCYSDVFIVTEDGIEKLPSLPRPLAFMSGARVGDVVYVAGGQESMDRARSTKNFWAYDSGWKELPPWPGPERIVPVCAAQSDGLEDCFYLFSGRKVEPGNVTELLTDAYVFRPSTGKWKRIADVPHCVMAAAAAPSGANHLLVFGGADGVMLRKLESAEEKESLLENHPGFSTDLLAYHTITDTWTKVGELPFTSPVTTTAVKRNDGFILPTGEISPGIRTPLVRKATPAPPAGFGWINYSVLGVYLAVLVGMGVYFSRREKSTDDFFKASGRVPWWAAGISIFGTQLSAITFMAVPAKTYATNWLYLTGNFTIFLVAPFIIWFFLPFFRRLNVTSAYEYLEQRFNLAVRLIGSAMFILFHLGRIGIVLFLPSIALNVVTGIDVSLCIAVMGILSITYTVLGGIEAVIWTDVLQVVVLLAGALLCLVVILFDIEGGWEMVIAANKLEAFDFTFDWSGPTFWVVLFGGLAANLISYGSDQSVIQRYLTTKDENSAARSIWTNGILCIPASLLFFTVGTALFVYYKSHPQMLNPTIENPDAVFPWFIVSMLPQGVAGLVIAAVFAASMSSLDSSMNSISAAVTTDYYRRFKPDAGEHAYLKLARWVTVIVGVGGTAFALMLAGWGIKSLWDQFFVFIGLFAGGLGGLFLLGIFTRRAGGAAALAGLVASGVVQYLVKQYTDIHFLLYTFTGMASCLVVGYLAGFIAPAGKNEGLTIHTLGRER